MKYYYQIEGKLRNNIGDTMQGIAAKAFLPDNAEVVDRENLSSIQNIEKGIFIANGWYMHNWSNFPPPDNIIPIYVAVHIDKSEMLLQKNIREHFKKYAPIGCRDKKTLRLFLTHGIPAYYSSCLTITAKKINKLNTSEKEKYLLIDNVDHPVPVEIQKKLETLIGQKLKKISHDPIGTDLPFDEFAKKSEQIMKQNLAQYCEAVCVITTKIHCALPCLGMGANVVLIHPNPNDPRLETVKRFMQIYSYKEIMEMDKLIMPKINKKKLHKYQNLLSYIVNQSVNKGYNIVSNPDTLKFKFIKEKSIVLAMSCKLVIKTMYNLHICRLRIKKRHHNFD
jgi:hypothetical protein